MWPAAPSQTFLLSPDLLVRVRLVQAPVTTENTSDMANKHTSVQDTVGTVTRDHADLT